MEIDISINMVKCPQCDREMGQATIGKPRLTLKGLPDNQTKLMQVVEFWDSGYSLTPMKLHIYFCEECSLNFKSKYGNFVIFKDGSIYGFTIDNNDEQCWEKFVKPIVPFKFR